MTMKRFGIFALSYVSLMLITFNSAHAQGCSQPHNITQWVDSAGLNNLQDSWTTQMLPTPPSCVAPVGLVDGTFANHVYSMDQNGHLIESFQSVIGGSWQVHDITQIVNGTTIASEPIPILLQNTPADIQIFALGGNGHLLSFVTTNNTFTYQVFDLTSLSGSIATLINSPAPIQFASTVHVFVTDSLHRLHDFVKPVSTNWQDVNFSTLLRGQIGVAPSPYAYGGNSIQIDAVAGVTQGDLVTFVQLVNSDGTRSGSPSVFDVTTMAHGTQIASLPRPLVVNNGADVAIFADDVNAALVQYFKAPSPSPWTEFNALLPHPGLTGLTPSAVFIPTDSTDRQVRLFSNSNVSHLFEYVLNPVTGAPAQSGADLTFETGVSIFSDPSAVINQGSFLVYTLNP
jgi:hypothetical protein